MSSHSTQFDATAGGLVLTSAILLYLNGAAAFASIHDVEEHDSGPVIAAGAPLTHAHLRQWNKALGKASAPEVLPPNVLVAHADLLAWWVPEQVRTAYFALSGPTAGLKALSGRTTVPVPYPAHLFVATRSGLGVYALPVNDRPNADTQLLHSPVLNIFLDGQLCWGNIAKPKTLTVATIGDYERAVFESWSTHPNPGQEYTASGKGGLVKLWDDLASAGAKRFPVKRLKSFNPNSNRKALKAPVTLGSLIAKGGRA